MRDIHEHAPAAHDAAPHRASWSAALRLYAVLLGAGIASLAWNLIALALHPFLSKDAGRRIGRLGISRGYGGIWAMGSAVGGLQIDASEIDALKDERGLILVANHPGMLDALLLVAHLPRSACIMKASLMRNVFLGAGARLARYIRNDSARAMVRESVADLKRGGQLVIFPEGTRTTTRPVGEFRPGVTLIAKLAGAPIQTVFIETDSSYLSKGWPIWRVPTLPLNYRLRVGRRFEPRDDSNALLAELEQYFRDSMSPTGRSRTET